MTNKIYPFFVLLLLFMATSCVKYKDLVNFQEGEQNTQAFSKAPTYILQPDDILSITVYSFDKAAAEPFNLNLIENSNSMAIAQSTSTHTYLVDEAGNIVMPIVGPTKVAGLSIPDARDTLKIKISKYIKDPIIHIRLQNFKITVVGEVNTPSTITFQEEKVSVLEALGAAGDMTQYARRDNILIIREIGDRKETIRVNLKSKDFVHSPYYYLTQNDVIYVEPLKSKTGAIADESNKYAPWVLAGITFINVFITLFR